ncbi:hypothetical protein LSAT2_022916 [Lamellibrachia satsuma]|nr:hypothetical protein LSAT2_022916 [Lamellibrachia satsuma]
MFKLHGRTARDNRLSNTCDHVAIKRGRFRIDLRRRELIKASPIWDQNLPPPTTTPTNPPPLMKSQRHFGTSSNVRYRKKDRWWSGCFRRRCGSLDRPGHTRACLSEQDKHNERRRSYAEHVTRTRRLTRTMETKNDGGSSSFRSAKRAALRPLDLVISIDTTLSMHGVLQEMRAAIDDILQRLFRDAVDLRVAIVAHGDYYDGDDAYVTKCVDFTKDAIELSRFVRTVEGTSGGDWAECYELVLHVMREQLTWRPASQRIVVMLGDSIPHEKNYPLNLQLIDWREEIDKLRDEMQVSVSGIQAYSDTEADSFWRQITTESGGRLLRLGCFEELVGIMVLSLVYNGYDENLFTAFEDEMLACEPNDRKCRLVRHMFETLRYDNRHQAGTAPAFVEPKALSLDNVGNYVTRVATNAAMKSQSDEPLLEVVLCFDTTMSMFGVTEALRQDIGALMARVYSEIKGIRVAMVVHGDYDSIQYSTMYIDFAQSDKPITEFVQRLQDTNDEHWDHSCKCYELALRQIRMQLSWTPHSRRVVIMVGDSRPHDTSYRLNVDKIDWRNELLFLHQDMDVTVYSVQLHADREADAFWYDMAKSTNGKHLHLGKFEKIVSTVIMAIIYKEEDIDSFMAYEDEILAYRGTGRRYDILRHSFRVLYTDDDDSLTSDPAAMCRPHPRKRARAAKPDTKPRLVQFGAPGLLSNAFHSWDK